MARVAEMLMAMMTPAVERMFWLLVVVVGSLVTATDLYLQNILLLFIYKIFYFIIITKYFSFLTCPPPWPSD